MLAADWRVVAALVCTLLGGMLAGCQPTSPIFRGPLDVKTGSGAIVNAPSSTQRLSTTIEASPSVPSAERSVAGVSGEPSVLADLPTTPANIYLNFDQVPLPALIQAIYADVLKKNVNIDPAVASRRDLVTLRTGSQLSQRDAAELANKLLASYGVSVLDVGGLVRIVPNNQGLGILPEIRRGRALPDTPQSLRPVFQLVELSVVRNIDVTNTVRTMFDKRVTVTEDANRNAVLLAGRSDDVAAALEVIQVLDQPLMKGRHSLRINPAYWAADDLVQKLNDVLQAEGYSIGPLGPGTQYPITLVSVPTVNAVLVFTADSKIADHVAAWARNLDRPNERNIGRNYFSYAVQNTDAVALATTLQQLLGGVLVSPAGGARPGAGAPATVAPAASAQTGPAARQTSVVVDRATNSLIFSANPDQYAQIVSLLQTLDRPARQALIEVTVAEVELTDNNELGVEWLFKNLRLDATGITAGLGGLALNTAGFTFTWTGANPSRSVIVNALASNNRTTILSNPSVLARNGETATISVGQDVPIVTSQQSTLNSSAIANNPGVLQTIQYRNTGVLLKVTPIIHSGDVIDLDLSQEVSEAQSTLTGVNISPTFLTRKLETKLTLRNGATVLLGGLISNSGTSSDTGIPYAKDIPVLGQLFRKDQANHTKRELIMLITPYIINDDGDARAVTEAFRRSLSPWAQPLLPPSGSLRGAGAPDPTTPAASPASSGSDSAPGYAPINRP